MGRARVQQSWHGAYVTAVDQYDQRTAASIHRRGNGSNRADIHIARLSHVDQCDLRVTVEQATGGIARAAGSDGAPSRLPGGLRKTVPITGRQYEKTALPVGCTVTAHKRNSSERPIATFPSATVTHLLASPQPLALARDKCMP